MMKIDFFVCLVKLDMCTQFHIHILNNLEGLNFKASVGGTNESNLNIRTQ